MRSSMRPPVANIDEFRTKDYTPLGVVHLTERGGIHVVIFMMCKLND